MAVPDPDDITSVQLATAEWYETQVFGALSHYFAVRTDDPHLGTYVAELLAPLASPEEAAASWYSLVSRRGTKSNGCSVYYGTEQLALASDSQAALSWLLHHANRQAVERCTRDVVLHAAAAEHAGRALLFPAPSGFGKSTLVAALVRAGLGYLTDEAVAVDPVSLEVRPYARPIVIKPGSQTLMTEIEPAPAPGERPRAGRHWLVPAPLISPDALVGAAPPTFVIAPRYQRGAATTLVPVRPSEAVMILAENSFNLVGHAEAGLAVLARVVKRSSCYRLVVGDLGAACRLVLRLVEAPDREDRPLVPPTLGVGEH